MDLNKLKLQTESEIADLRQFMSQSKADCADPLDNASLNEQINIARVQLARKMHNSRMIVRAIERQRAGDYGFCEACGNDIEPKRLAFNPAAECCADCEQIRYAKSIGLTGRTHH
jgi:DnaK suppressor protein